MIFLRFLPFLLLVRFEKFIARMGERVNIVNPSAYTRREESFLFFFSFLPFAELKSLWNDPRKRCGAKGIWALIDWSRIGGSAVCGVSPYSSSFPWERARGAKKNQRMTPSANGHHPSYVISSAVRQTLPGGEHISTHCLDGRPPRVPPSRRKTWWRWLGPGDRQTTSWFIYRRRTKKKQHSI